MHRQQRRVRILARHLSRAAMKISSVCTRRRARRRHRARRRRDVARCARILSTAALAADVTGTSLFDARIAVVAHVSRASRRARG
jgi:hypothetical protein